MTDARAKRRAKRTKQRVNYRASFIVQGLGARVLLCVQWLPSGRMGKQYAHGRARTCENDERIFTLERAA